MRGKVSDDEIIDLLSSGSPKRFGEILETVKVSPHTLRNRLKTLRLAGEIREIPDLQDMRSRRYLLPQRPAGGK